MRCIYNAATRCNVDANSRKISRSATFWALERNQYERLQGQDIQVTVSSFFWYIIWKVDYINLLIAPKIDHLYDINRNENSNLWRTGSKNHIKRSTQKLKCSAQNGRKFGRAELRGPNQMHCNDNLSDTFLGSEVRFLSLKHLTGVLHTLNT